ncbi:GW dipeptide domain-containing protein, partial [Bhargavaea massiliensis]|uniref:GW dipeptide domain-containing protein n=1 Tax=Bhargavaea massiliensis TaxID=2697500 RepID=UPI001BCC05A4
RAFTVNLTEKVGNNLWYRGVIDGKNAWIHESGLIQNIEVDEQKTSRLGHLRSSGVRIYKSYASQSDYMNAGSTYTNEVYYIKKQATYQNTLYYLISRNASSTKGVIGWVKASDMSTHPHVGVDKNAKVFYIKGTGHAYNKAWGGRKNISYENLSKIKDRAFTVNLTEKVGNNLWYRGVIDGKNAWIHESGLIQNIEVDEQKTSRLGHLRSSGVRIYKSYASQSDYM